MALRKKLHNQLVDLKGNIRVFCRIRPPIAEDGTGKPEVQNFAPSSQIFNREHNILPFGFCLISMLGLCMK